MRELLMFALMLSVAGPAMAIDLGSQAPAKPADNSVYVAPEGAILQGGNTIEEAIPITIPGTFTGTTVGYTNNYDYACPYLSSTAPDVVYAVTPAADIAVDIDLCYSFFDTKLYVYDEGLNVIACNDDFYSGAPCYTYSSKLENVPLQAGATYSIVIDGYGSAAGDYQMDIEEFVPCILECPIGAQLEGEPPLQDGYEDAHNSGCGGSQFGVPFQSITEPVFCGVSGWYIGDFGGETRDTDWFHIIVPEGGVLEVTGDAEFATYMFELGPQDCGNVGVVQNVIMGPCLEATMSIVGAPGSLVWFWVGPTTFTGPVNEYNYVLNLNIPGEIVATENHSWTGVKSLFR
jgi:hypothetical protein